RQPIERLRDGRPRQDARALRVQVHDHDLVLLEPSVQHCRELACRVDGDVHREVAEFEVSAGRLERPLGRKLNEPVLPQPGPHTIERFRGWLALLVGLGLFGGSGFRRCGRLLDPGLGGRRGTSEEPEQQGCGERTRMHGLPPGVVVTEHGYCGKTGIGDHEDSVARIRWVAVQRRSRDLPQSCDSVVKPSSPGRTHSMSDPNALPFDAIGFAARAHRHQLRKDRDTPYVSHVFRVCLVVRHVFGFDDPKILAAAVLHDTIEDTPTDCDDIIERFGPDVARWVAALTKDMRLPYDEREAAYLRVLEAAEWQGEGGKIAGLYGNLAGPRHPPPEGREKKGDKLPG